MMTGLRRTDKFSVFETSIILEEYENPRYHLDINLNCDYVDSIVRSISKVKPNCQGKKNNDGCFTVQVGDFENINWDNVLNGKEGASSYLVRKGLSRKAQLSLQLRRYMSKHPESILKISVPATFVVETWNAFEEMKLDFGRGTFCSFDPSVFSHSSLRDKLDFCLSDTRSLMEDPETVGWTWILKPSVTNKGADISLNFTWSDILDRLEENPDIREWVLQRYVENPLLIGNHKFHLRVYVICVGALRVFVFDQILMLFAAHRYSPDDPDAIFGHLTNTARAAEDINFDEKKFVKLLDDLPFLLHRKNPKKFPTVQSTLKTVNKIKSDIHLITADLFKAYENEYSIFCPLHNCFELFGLDFLVDDDFNIHFLEINPGPDFKQTGDRLQNVIKTLWEQTFSLVFDCDLLKNDNKVHTEIDQKLESVCQTKPDVNIGRRDNKDFSLVYSKEWSVAGLKSGFSMVDG